MLKARSYPPTTVTGGIDDSGARGGDKVGRGESMKLLEHEERERERESGGNERAHLRLRGTRERVASACRGDRIGKPIKRLT